MVHAIDVGDQREIYAVVVDEQRCATARRGAGLPSIDSYEDRCATRA